MSKFSKPTTAFGNAPIDGSIDLPPTMCGHCHAADTQIALVIVNDRTGTTKSGPFSEYGFTRRHREGGDQKLYMRDGIEFIQWWTRCAPCYGRLIDAQTRRFEGVSETPVPNAKRAVKELVEGATV